MQFENADYFPAADQEVRNIIIRLGTRRRGKRQKTPGKDVEAPITTGSKELKKYRIRRFCSWSWASCASEGVSCGSSYSECLHKIKYRFSTVNLRIYPLLIGIFFAGPTRRKSAIKWSKEVTNWVWSILWLRKRLVSTGTNIKSPLWRVRSCRRTTNPNFQTGPANFTYYQLRIRWILRQRKREMEREISQNWFELRKVVYFLLA